MKECYRNAARKMLVFMILSKIPASQIPNCQECHGGAQFRFANGGDIVCHDYSYGHEEGLWESYGFPWDGNDVTGGLTTEEFISLYEKYCL